MSHLRQAQQRWDRSRPWLANENSAEGITSWQDLTDVEEKAAHHNFFKNTGRTFFRYIRHHWGLFGFAILLMLVATGASVLPPMIIGNAIDHGIIPKRWNILWMMLGLLFLAEITRAIATFGYSYLSANVGQRIMQDLRVDMMAHVQRLSMTTFDQIAAGKLVTRLSNDINVLSDLFTGSFVGTFAKILFVFGTIGTLLFLHFKLALICLSVMPFLIFLSYLFTKRLLAQYRAVRSKLSGLNAFLAETIFGISVVQWFNRQPHHVDRFREINESYTEAQFATTRTFALYHPIISVSTAFSMALAIGFGAVFVKSGEMPIGNLVAFFGYIVALFAPLADICDKWNIFLSGLTSAERISSVLAWKPESELSDVRRPARRSLDLRGSIIFEGVGFSYLPNRPVLRDLSFEIKPGERIGLIGPTGAGKTSLINLLLRFHEPTEGKIYLDGKLLSTYPKRELRRSMGLIQQDVSLFSGTLRDNITLWDDTGDLDQFIKDHDEWAGLLKFPNGLETLIGERGQNLSAGQRQLIALARALFARPSILLLDEATANVDTESQRVVDQLFGKLTQGRTCIAIAHRLATVRDFDRIFVLEQGQIVESGAHQELIRKDGLYAELFKLNDWDASRAEART